MFIKKYIKEFILESVVSEEELSYDDHLKKLRLAHQSEVENILRDNIYSNKYRGTSMYNFFNEISKGYSMSELGDEGLAAIDNILEYLPEIPYVEEGIDLEVVDIISYQVEQLIQRLIKLTQNIDSVRESRIYQAIKRAADSITNEWSLIYLKKKKLKTDYITTEDPAQQIIDNLDLESHSEQVQELINLYVQEYYDNVQKDPQEALESLKYNLGFFTNV
tara:strand:+ start:56 stop:715 length:660 start_codon:yes stop_codon:yes gene_type:complete